MCMIQWKLNSTNVFNHFHCCFRCRTNQTKTPLKSCLKLCFKLKCFWAWSSWRRRHKDSYSISKSITDFCVIYLTKESLHDFIIRNLICVFDSTIHYVRKFSELRQSSLWQLLATEFERNMDTFSHDQNYFVLRSNEFIWFLFFFLFMLLF